MRVEDQPRNLVIFIGHQWLLNKAAKRQIGEADLSRHPLLGARCGHSGQLVARALGRGLRHKLFEIGKAIRSPAQGLLVARHQVAFFSIDCYRVLAIVA